MKFNKNAITFLCISMFGGIFLHASEMGWIVAKNLASQKSGEMGLIQCAYKTRSGSQFTINYRDNRNTFDPMCPQFIEVNPETGQYMETTAFPSDWPRN